MVRVAHAHSASGRDAVSLYGVPLLFEKASLRCLGTRRVALKLPALV